MISFSNKNHLDKQNEKKTTGECPRFHVWSKKRPQKNKGENWDMALGVKHVYQLLKKAQETEAAW